MTTTVPTTTADNKTTVTTKMQRCIYPGMHMLCFVSVSEMPLMKQRLVFLLDLMLTVVITMIVDSGSCTCTGNRGKQESFWEHQPLRQVLWAWNRLFRRETIVLVFISWQFHENPLNCSFSVMLINSHTCKNRKSCIQVGKRKITKMFQIVPCIRPILKTSWIFIHPFSVMLLTDTPSRLV